jgi:predicted acetyltransferase
MAEWFEIPTDTGLTYSFEGYDAYLAKSADSPVGFALIGTADEWLGNTGGHDVHEFFILRRYRRNGFGQKMATLLWDQRPGEWLVRVLELNAPAVSFWRTVVAGYSRGAYHAYQEETRVVNGHSWRFFRFLSNSPLTNY